jgi:uncharacterized protein (DUF58 family)
LGLLDFLSPAATPSASSGELFDDEFQRKLDSLALVSRRAFAGRMRAERRTRKIGSGIEFADHRDYQPGDDFRYLDWGIYQRFDRLLVRLFEEEEDLSIYFIVDQSASMAFGDGQKFRAAARICAALAYVGLANLDRVTIIGANAALSGRMPETRGKARIFKVFRFLQNLSTTGSTSLEQTLRTFVAQNKRRGLAVLISDLYDPAGCERGINVLRYNKFDPFVVHITDPRERELELFGDVTLYDCETGDERDVTVTPALLRQYREAYDLHLAEVERFCTGHMVPYTRADANVDFEELILRVFRKGGFLR